MTRQVPAGVTTMIFRALRSLHNEFAAESPELRSEKQ